MRKTLISVAIAAVVVGSAGTALAVSGSGAPSATHTNAIAGCLTPSRTVVNVHPDRTWVLCRTGDQHIRWNITGPKGATGAQGPAGLAGPAGPQGPSGVVSANTTDVTNGTPVSVNTGGGFVANATEVGTVSLKAGTYVLSLNAKATPPVGGTGTADVFPQFFVYNQAKNSTFTGDLFNVGAGALESGSHNTIDSYYSGSTVLTLATDTTLYVYAFGYDSDTGAGSYTLDDLSITAIQITPGS